MPQTMTGTIRGNVITLDAQAPISRRGQPEGEQRVRVALEILKRPPRSTTSEEEDRRENLKRLAQINDAVSGGPDPEERELRKRMRRLLRQRGLEE